MISILCSWETLLISFFTSFIVTGALTTTLNQTVPTHGNFTQWSTWSNCSVPCGDGGVTSRNRTYTNPFSRNSGRDGDGKRQEEKSCNKEPCKKVICQQVDRIIEGGGGELKKNAHNNITCSIWCREKDGCKGWIWYGKNGAEEHRSCRLMPYYGNLTYEKDAISGNKTCGLPDKVMLSTKKILIASLSAWSILIVVFVLAAVLLKRKEQQNRIILRNYHKKLLPSQSANDTIEQEDSHFGPQSDERQAIPLLKIPEEIPKC